MARSRHLKTLIVLFGAVAAGASQPGEPDSKVSLSAIPGYEQIASHLCSDLEYLACFKVSTIQCLSDMESTALKACAEQAYLRSDAPDSERPTGPVPSGMIECLYSAHIELRALDQSAVNRCMAEAKLGN